MRMVTPPPSVERRHALRWLSAIVFDDPMSLSAARQREDQHIIDFVETLDLLIMQRERAWK